MWIVPACGCEAQVALAEMMINGRGGRRDLPEDRAAVQRRSRARPRQAELTLGRYLAEGVVDSGTRRVRDRDSRWPPCPQNKPDARSTTDRRLLDAVWGIVPTGI
jgi:hypothetical protein